MSLHGDVRVNGQLIGSWTARRTTNLASQTQVSTYECDVRWLGPDGIKAYARETFTVDHRYSDGAAALACKVLSQASQPNLPLGPTVSTTYRIEGVPA